MTYANEHIATALKKAREDKGLSQRELSARSGVPQSHISKIERSSVDLRLSSLGALANALDLELTMIPRKAAPAVKAIVRNTSNSRPQDDIRGLVEARLYHEKPAYSLDEDDNE